MSSNDKIPLAVARENAERFKALFPAATWELWEIAGSVRRNIAMVGDLEHVVIPRFGMVPEDEHDLFAGAGKMVRRNLLWERLLELCELGTMKPFVRQNGRKCWGEKLRAIDFEGTCHELYTCQPEGFGNTLAIRTGPHEYSKHLVTIMQTHGYRCEEGRVLNRHNLPVDCLTEEKFFEYAGVPWIPPERRRAPNVPPRH